MLLLHYGRVAVFFVSSGTFSEFFELKQFVLRWLAVDRKIFFFENWHAQSTEPETFVIFAFKAQIMIL